MENILFFLPTSGDIPPCGAEWGGPDPPGGNPDVVYNNVDNICIT